MDFLYKEELSDNDGVYVRFGFPEEDDWIFVDWIGYQDETRIITGMNHLLELLKKFNVRKILNNNNNHHGPYPEVTYEWIENDWLPRARESGLQYTATILSPKVFSRYSALHMESKFSSEKYKNFDDKDEAVNWLRSVQAT